MSGPATENTRLTDGAKLPVQHRTLSIDVERMLDEEKRTIELSFSSEEPVERWFGREILDHSDGIDFARLNNGAALLRDHDMTKQIGVVEKAWIDGKTGRAVVRLSKEEDGEREFREIIDGIRTKISFGYRIKQVVLEEQNDDSADVYRVTDWEPYEISTVSIPADDTVGIGRNESPGNLPITLTGETRQAPNPPKQTMKPEDTGGGAATPPAPTPDRAAILREERERQSEFRAIGTKFGLKPDDVQRSLDSDVSLAEFRAKVMTDFSPADLPAPKADLRLGMNKKERGQFSIVKGMREIARGGDVTGIEREVYDECIKRNPDLGADRQLLIPMDVLETGRRDLEAGEPAEGGFTVATDTGSMIELLRNSQVTTAMGATQLSGLRGNLALPKQTGGATAAWVDEEGEIADSAQAFGQVLLSPSRLASRTAYSDQLLNQSTLSIEQFVRGDLMTVIALALDHAAIQGDGTGSIPTGIVSTVGVNAVTFGGPPTWAKVVEFETACAVDNALMGSLGYLTTPAVRGAWKTTIKDASGSGGFLWAQNEVNGYKAEASNQVDGDLVIFGNWAELIMATWGVMSVIVDPYTKAATGQRVITINSFHDIAVRHPESFAVSADAGNQTV